MLRGTLAFEGYASPLSTPLLVVIEGKTPLRHEKPCQWEHHGLLLLLLLVVGLDRMLHCKCFMKKFMHSTLRRAFCETVDGTTHF